MEGEITPPTHTHTHPEGHGPRLLVREPISTIITLRSHFGWGASMLGAPVPPPPPLHSLSSSLPSPQTGNGEIKLQTTGPKCLISRRPTAPAEPSLLHRKSAEERGAWPSHQHHVTLEGENTEVAMIKQLSGHGEPSHRNGWLFWRSRGSRRRPGGVL